MGVTYPRSEELAYGYVTVGNTTVIAFTGVVAGSALTARRVYRVVATQNCFISFGTSNDATSSAAFLPANAIEYFGIGEDDTNLSVIQDSTGGNLHVTEMVAARPWIV